jgi:DNA ligase (NAD+)
MLYWCRALEMDGIGEKLVEQLLEEGAINTLGDLYRMSMSTLLNLERMGEKSASNVLSEVEKSRHMTLGRFLHALGLPGIGPELAFSVARELRDAHGLMSWLDQAHAETDDDAFGPAEDETGKHYEYNQALRRLMALEGVGTIVALHVRDGLEARRSTVEDLLNELEISPESQLSEGGVFDTMTFCVTGTLSKPRKEIQQLITDAGGKIVGSVSAKLSVLVAGEKAGSKKAKAEQLEVVVWNEADLMNHLETDPSDVQADEEVQANQQPSLLDFS